MSTSTEDSDVHVTVEALFRVQLIDAYQVFSEALIKASKEVVPATFTTNTPEDGERSLRKLLEKISTVIDHNREEMEELALSEGPLLRVRHVGSEH